MRKRVRKMLRTKGEASALLADAAICEGMMQRGGAPDVGRFLPSMLFVDAHNALYHGRQSFYL